MLERLRSESGVPLILGPHTDKCGPSHLSTIILKYGEGEGKKGKCIGLFKVRIREDFPRML